MSLGHHNKVLRAGEKRALELEGRFVRVLAPILEQAGREAARAFTANVTNHLTAAAHRHADRHAAARIPLGERRPLVLTAAMDVQATSTMICVKPRPDEAAALADPDGLPAETLHCTLAYLGELDGDLRPILDVLGAVAGSHAALAGIVGGYGQFGMPDGSRVGILLPDVPGLVELRVAVTEALTEAGIDYARNHGFEAHLTIDPDPEAGELEEMLPLSGSPLHFDELLLVRGDTEIHPLPLVGVPPITAAANGLPGEPVPPGEMPKYLYHVGMASAKDSIAKHGLLPGGGGYGPEHPGQQFPTDFPGVYGHETLEGALNDLEQVNEFDPGAWAIYRFKIPAGKEHAVRLDSEGAFAFTERVPPSDISVSSTGSSWEALESAAAEAGEVAHWTAPAASELLDVERLVASLRTKTDPVRRAVVETMMKQTLGEPRASLEEALAYYHSPKAFELNAALREGKTLTAEQQGIVNALDAAMEAAPHSLTLYRGVPNFPDVFHTRSVADLSGKAWSTPGYLSTSRDVENAEQFAGGIAGAAERPLIMEIRVPKGTPMVRIPAGDYGDQDEWLLPRDLRVGLGAVSTYEDSFGSRTVSVTSNALNHGTVGKNIEGPLVKGMGISFDVSNPLVAKVLAQTGSQIVDIAKTTQTNVMRIISASYEQGLTIPDTAKAIRVGMSEAAGVRATLIARTELAGAVNGGSLAATQIVQNATGTNYSKKWLTASGAKYPRHEDYEGLDGQTVALNEPFDVGGAQMQHPGDPDGPADEICNCRCTMSYGEAE